MTLHPRVVCSTISFRRSPLHRALSLISELGFRAIDLGALPGVCDHVPYELTSAAVSGVAATIEASGLAVRSINADVGDLNRVVDVDEAAEREAHLAQLFDLAQQVGAPAIVLPCGAPSHEPLQDLRTDIGLVADSLRHAAKQAVSHGLEIWVESQHSGRLCWNLERTQQLTTALTGSGVRAVLDLSHVVASGDDILTWIDRLAPEIAHVHLRDARRGDIHLTPGSGDVDFAAALHALADRGYTGDYSLELETADVTEDERPATARRAGEFISSLL